MTELNGEDTSTCTDQGVNSGVAVQECGFPDNSNYTAQSPRQLDYRGHL